MVRGIDTNTIILDRAFNHRTACPGIYFDSRIWLLPHELDRVFDKVLEDFQQAQRIAPISWHVLANVEFDTTLFYLVLKTFRGLFGQAS